MTHEEKLHIDLLWYQAMEDCVKEDSVRYAFAALVRVDEREACAKVCEKTGKEPDDHKSYEGYVEGYQDGSNNCAAAIRARSNP